ncbi:exopolysaccharide biosynthesis polyprenyl glycosylphosphotransferase [Robiginitomaculum antarcticum]|uniref:exopolysaccharide biosynthesis polyprenyl glycosylphosphotransferase n=1 Tax=Robiginitomaculum antarcticum TaxID=437507 RepID=UPI00037EF9A2|nr:exopolysaccharide biosynthesis polyprenyl glycosylphosphotransferase [Robiginitomaculum antarcticum]
MSLNPKKMPSGKPVFAQTKPRKIETLDEFSRRSSAPAPEKKLEAVSSESSQGRKPRVPLSSISIPEKQMSKAALRAGIRIIDVCVVSLIIMIAVWNSYVGINGKEFMAPLAAGLLGTVIFGIMLIVGKAHEFAPSERYGKHIRRLSMASFAAMGVWLCAALIIKPDTFLPDALAIAGLCAIAALLILHTLYYGQVRRLYNQGQLTPTIVMLGATEGARRLIEENARTRELNIVAIFDARLSRAPYHIHGVPVVGDIDDLLAWDALPYVDRIVVALPGLAEQRKADYVRQVHLLPNRIAFIDDEFETLDHVKQRLTSIANIGLREVTGKPKTGAQILSKRALDLVVSTTALILSAPFLALLALVIKLDSPGPVLFKQPRHGFNNRIFYVYKFRSMRNDAADSEARVQTQAEDARITKIGRFIRKTSIDELPQLWNVLKGEMSLVGPRPHAVGMRTQGKASIELVSDYAHRHKVKPGMTGWAQINGSRGPLHDQADIARRVRLDVEYIENSNVFFDILIMLKTLPCLLGDSENIR